MAVRARQLVRFGLIAAAVAGGAERAAADPILTLPPVGWGLVAGAVDGPGVVGGRAPIAAGRSDPDRIPGRTGVGALALVAELSAYQTMVAGGDAVFPQVGAIEGGEPELAALRAGLVGWSGCRPFGFALEADLASGLRLDDHAGGHPLAAADAWIRDALVAFTPTEWFQVWLGRQAVPLSRFRSFPQATLMGGAVPFLVDRVAPDRRWGAQVAGDLGALAYAAGVYADGDRFEPVPPPEPASAPDPSAGGRGAVGGRIEWTPRAPMGPDSAPGPAGAPWTPVPRVSAGLGVLWRWREPALGQRLDLALSGQGALGRWSALAELLLSSEHDRTALGFSAEAGFLAWDRLLVFARGDDDGDTGWWSAGGGASWFATRDRWNKLTLVGWVRRHHPDDAPSASGIMAQLSAAL